MIRPAFSDLWVKLKDWQIGFVVQSGDFPLPTMGVYVRLTDNSATAWIRVRGAENCAFATVKGTGYERRVAAVCKAALLANKSDKPCADAQPFLDALIGRGNGAKTWQIRLAEECSKRPGFGFVDMC
jgi:hypothetical protein